MKVVLIFSKENETFKQHTSLRETAKYFVPFIVSKEYYSPDLQFKLKNSGVKCQFSELEL